MPRSEYKKPELEMFENLVDITYADPGWQGSFAGIGIPGLGAGGLSGGGMQGGGQLPATGVALWIYALFGGAFFAAGAVIRRFRM